MEIDLVSHEGEMQGEIMPKHLMSLMYVQLGQRHRQLKIRSDINLVKKTR